jgi:chromate reductase, NAD(P)H dehydrogenase (quinone)
MPHGEAAFIVGSNRRDSINRKLARALAKLGADKFEASFVRIDDLPMFNQDLEGNLPGEVVRFERGDTGGFKYRILPKHPKHAQGSWRNACFFAARPVVLRSSRSLRVRSARSFSG